MPICMDALPAWHCEAIVGSGFTRSNSWSNAAFVDLVAPKRQADLFGGIEWSPMFTFGGIGGVSRFGRDDKTVWFLGAGARVQLPERFFASFELGAVAPRTPAFSSTYEFATSLGWQWERFVISVRHISNAGLKEPNFGETMILAGITF